MQDERLLEYGDIIVPSLANNEREVFLHIPTKDEVIELIDEADFQLVETFFRSDLFKETQKIKDFSGECRFFIVQK